MNRQDKKQIPLRLPDSLYRDLSAWAQEDFRSLNGQIEYLLSECVRKRKKTRYTSSDTDPGIHGDPKN